MLDALAAGQRDPKALAQLARGSMRSKIRRLEQALDCSLFTDQHATVLAMMLAAIDYYSAQIDALTATIEALAGPWLRQLGPAGDPMAVVDQHGRLRAIPNLRVADASVMPAIPRANINLTCIMIGEHISDWIRGEA